jgi:hypothetical protein
MSSSFLELIFLLNNTLENLLLPKNRIAIPLALTVSSFFCTINLIPRKIYNRNKKTEENYD